MFELTDPKYKENLEQKLRELPDSPGVYLHRDAEGGVIYVGKAVALKNRVRSYFQSPKNHSPKVCALVRNIADFSYVLVDSETEALTLESNFIKQYRPYYNVLLKDDKTFPYVRMDLRSAYPRAEIVNKLKDDGAKYFGPYLSRHAVREALEAVGDNFPIRRYNKDIKKAQARGERPCLYFHLGKCSAPCCGNVSQEEYKKTAEQVASFLSGHTETVVQKLTAEMTDASIAMEYERAAVLRDRIRSIQAISERQKAIAANTDERDVLALARLNDQAIVYALFVRGGKVIGANGYELTGADEADPVVLASFLTQFYDDAYIPREIVLPFEPEDAEAISSYLYSRLGKKVTLTVPRRGDKLKLVAMAHKNGRELLEKAESRRLRRLERTEGALAELAEALGMAVPPRRIECYDISHTMGTEPVASMVVFTEGEPQKSLYRRFKVKNSANDDYAAMAEVLARRFERYKSGSAGFSEAPDLLLIDGGKGQLGVAVKTMAEAGVAFFAAGLSERLEEVWLPGREASIILERGSAGLHLLQRVRDEAHRFAITFHRSLRNKNSLASGLEQIPGVGPKRRRALLSAFPSPDAIRAATAQEIAEIDGVDKRTAQLVFAHFHPDISV